MNFALLDTVIKSSGALNNIPIFLLLLLRPSSNSSSEGISNIDGRSGRPLRALPGVRWPEPRFRDEGVCAADTSDLAVSPRTDVVCEEPAGSVAVTVVAGCGAGSDVDSGGAEASPNENPKSIAFVLRVLPDESCSQHPTFFIKGESIK